MKKAKLFLATYFKTYKEALMYAAKQNVGKGKDIFDVIASSQGYFVVSKSVLKTCFGKRGN